MSAQILPFPERGLDRAQLIKALLRRFVQVTADRRAQPRRRSRVRPRGAALERADRAVRAEVRALERLIEALSQGGGAVQEHRPL